MNNLSYTLFGIIAVLVGFCTWASIRLRASRIKAIRDQAANELLKADLATANIRAKEWAAEAARLRDNAGTMADMTAEYKVKAEILETESQMRSETISGFIKEVEELRSAQSRLIECIQHTGIRGRDGVVRKATKEQIEQMKQGLSPQMIDWTKEPKFRIEAIPSKPTRDWSVPQAFPIDYEIPKGTKVIKVAESDRWVKRGSVGIYKSTMTVEWESEDYDMDGSGIDWCQSAFKLAPVNPTDHPEHPQFKNKKA